MTFEQWGILELMGHVKTAGRISEEERFGSKIGRIDIPAKEGFFVTQYFGGASVYRLTICTEETARAIAARCNHNLPMTEWDIREYIQPLAIELAQEREAIQSEDDFEELFKPADEKAKEQDRLLDELFTNTEEAPF